MTRDLQSIAKSLNSSGHNLHLRIFNSIDSPTNLQSRFQDTLFAPYYIDESTGLAREIDVVVRNEMRLLNDNHEVEMKQVRIFIECKYLKQPVIFLENKLRYEEQVEILKKQFCVSSLSNSFKFTQSRFKRFLDSQKIAMVCEPFDQLFGAFDTCVKAMRAENKNIAQPTINYLWVVVDGEMYKVKEGLRKEKGEKYLSEDCESVDHEIMVVNYTKDGLVGNDKLFVEFIHERRFVEFLDKIWDECRAIHGL